jgi:hypothetical protein
MGEGERFGSRKQSHCSGSLKVGRKRLPLLGERAGVRGMASFELAWIGLKAGLHTSLPVKVWFVLELA